MSLSPEQIETLAEKYIIELYDNMEREVIADIARRVKKTERFTETAELMARNMREQGYSPNEIQKEVFKLLRADDALKKEIAENTKAYKQDVKQIIAETVQQAKTAGDTLIAEAGDMAWNDDLQMWKAHGVNLKKDNTLAQLQKAFEKQTRREFKNLTRTTGFKGTKLGTTGVLNAYQRAMDLASLKVATGVTSYDQAVKDVVKQLAHSGLRTIDYASGRSYELDTAARMVVRTATSQYAGKITEHNIDKTGTELVYVSAHAGARPEHEEWQGKVYSYDGSNKKYEDFVSSTGYGDADGLKGVNCTHEFYPYWDGDDIPKFVEPDPVEVDGKTYSRYEANQEQRKREREIRATRREIEALDSIKAGSIEERKKLHDQIASYNEFSYSAGIKPKPNRYQVLKGTSNI